MSDHDLHSLAHVGEAHRTRSSFAPIDHDRAVQHRRTDFQFLAANAHERLAEGRAVRSDAHVAAEGQCRGDRGERILAALRGIPTVRDFQQGSGEGGIRTRDGGRPPIPT